MPGAAIRVQCNICRALPVRFRLFDLKVWFVAPYQVVYDDKPARVVDNKPSSILWKLYNAECVQPALDSSLH